MTLTASTEMINTAMKVTLKSVEVPVYECMDVEDVRQVVDAALSVISDEEFKAEAQRRVTRFSPDEFMTDLQSNDRAKLDTLRSAVIEAKVASIHAGENHPALIALASLCDKLDSITGHKPAQAIAVNTTMPGREGEIQS